MIKELLKVNEQVNRILAVAEEEDTEFPAIVGDLNRHALIFRRVNHYFFISQL